MNTNTATNPSTTQATPAAKTRAPHRKHVSWKPDEIAKIATRMTEINQQENGSVSINTLKPIRLLGLVRRAQDVLEQDRQREILTWSLVSAKLSPALQLALKNGAKEPRADQPRRLLETLQTPPLPSNPRMAHRVTTTRPTQTSRTKSLTLGRRPRLNPQSRVWSIALSPQTPSLEPS